MWEHKIKRYSGEMVFIIYNGMDICWESNSGPQGRFMDRG